MLKKIRAKISRSRADSGADEAGSAQTTPSNNEGNASTVAGPKDLWQVAFDGLDPKHKPWLSQDKQIPLEVLQEVIDETEKKYTEYKKKQLTIRRRDGGEIKVREVAQKILASALNVQDVIKAIATFDPTGHGMMIKTNIERRDSILEASEYLADKLAYFTVIDSDRRYTKGAGNQQLEKALVKIYGAILEYAAEVRKTYSESLTGKSKKYFARLLKQVYNDKCLTIGCAARIGSTLIPLTEQPLQKLRKAVDDKSTVTEKWAAVTNWSYLKGQAEELLTAIDKNVEELQKVHSVVLSAEEREILEWLSQSDFSNAQRNAQDHRSPGTGDWFLKLADYKEWKACPGNFFWLQGVAGCGKSVIWYGRIAKIVVLPLLMRVHSSTIIEDIDRACRDNPKKRLAYWYFQFNVLESQRVENILRGIIRQLHSSPLDEAIRSIWTDYGTKGGHPSNTRLLETLHGVINAYQGDVFLILDALDECPESPDRRERSVLLSLLTELQREHSNKLHILVTGRPEPDMTEKLGDCTVLDLEECQGSDISTFVKLKVGSLDARIAPNEVKKQIIDDLLQKEKKRFRWADLQIKRLEECRVKSEVLEALRTMPETLEDIYLTVIDKISSRPSDVRFAKSILTWLSFSVRPLTLREVAEAAGLEVPEDVIRICTTSFVTFRRSENEIKLSHFSVKEFLVDIKRTGQWYQLSSLSCHAVIAEHSLHQVLLQQTERRYATDAVYAADSGLLGYAACKWYEHFNASAVMSSSSKLQGMAGDLFRQPIVYRNWRCSIPELGEQKVQSAPIGVASELGLFTVVKGLLEDGVDHLEYAHGDFWISRYNNPLWSASFSGNLDVLDLLLSNLNVRMISRTAEAILKHLKCHGRASKTLEDIVEKLSHSGVIYAQPTDTKLGLQIDERMVVAVAKNENCGSKLMAILLDQFEETGTAAVPVTKQVLRAMLRNKERGSDILQLLLKRRPADVQITTEELREMMAHYSGKVNGRVIELFLEARHMDIDIDEQLIDTFAKYASDTEMRTLLSKLSSETFLTEYVLSNAACNEVGAGAMHQILQRKNRAPVSRHVIHTAAGQIFGSHRVEVMEALLDECGPNFPLGITFMSLVLNNWTNAAEMLNMLLHRQQAGFIVTYDILYEAAYYQNKDVFEILINNGGLKIPITEDIMIRVLRRMDYDFVRLILHLTERSQIHPLFITENVLLIALRESKPDTLRAILQRRPISQVSNDMFVASCVNSSPKVLLLLLQLPHQELPIMEMMQALEDQLDAKGEKTTAKIQGLLNEMTIEIDQEHLETFADRPHTLEFLLQKKPNLRITEKVVIQAAKRKNALRILLNKRMKDIPMSDEVIVSIVKLACQGQISS
ncbi:hypothetical protein N7528_008301 [Penicillium herquei]|nr:hypothetical protein N7528_008301 [Penicillium herquei]